MLTKLSRVLKCGKLVNTLQDTNGVNYLDAANPGDLNVNGGIPGIDALVVEGEDVVP